MSVLELEFIITWVRECPLYDLNDRFKLDGVALSFPKKKPACLFLSRVITEIVIENMDSAVSGRLEIAGREFSCPGCTGIIKFAYSEEKKYHTVQMALLAAADKRKQGQEISSLVSLLGSFSFFQALDEESLKDVTSCLKMHSFRPGEFILRRGETGKHLYIVISGHVTLLDDEGMNIAFLGMGEIFGEMSLFTGKPVSATVKAVEAVKVLLLSGKDLSHILLKHPYLQMAFTRLLANRLWDTNVSWSKELASGITGQIQEVSVAELFQMLHENTKTGVFESDLPSGKAEVVFREGEVITALYSDKKGEDAFFDILREKEGRFKFAVKSPSEVSGGRPIGGFMKLLMEGLRRIDEQSV